VPLHPEGHVRQHRGREPERHRLEDHLDPGPGVAGDGDVRDDAADGCEQQRRSDAEQHVAEELTLAGPVQVRQQDGDDHACLDGFPQEDDQGG
jgi:hypothetical protein